MMQNLFRKDLNTKNQNKIDEYPIFWQHENGYKITKIEQSK